MSVGKEKTLVPDMDVKFFKVKKKGYLEGCINLNIVGKVCSKHRYR